MNSKMKSILIGISVLLNFCVLGLGSYWVYTSTMGYESPSITEKSLRTIASLPEHLNEGVMVYTMDKFVVNLAGLPKRTIRIQINLDMISAESFEGIMDNENRARARDKIVRLLNEKTFDELETIQGKLFLKDKIVQEVNSVLKVGLVKDVYFTDFVMN
jgi:flagellar protein FliL